MLWDLRRLTGSREELKRLLIHDYIYSYEHCLQAGTIYSQICGVASLAGCLVLPLDLPSLLFLWSTDQMYQVCFGSDALVVFHMMRSHTIVGFQQLLGWASKRLAFCKNSCRVNAVSRVALFSFSDQAVYLTSFSSKGLFIF